MKAPRFGAFATDVEGGIILVFQEGVEGNKKETRKSGDAFNYDLTTVVGCDGAPKASLSYGG